MALSSNNGIVYDPGASHEGFYEVPHLITWDCAMAILASVKVGKNHRITIPKEVRDVLKINEGSEVIFFTTEGWKRRVGMRT